MGLLVLASEEWSYKLSIALTVTRDTPLDTINSHIKIVSCEFSRLHCINYMCLRTYMYPTWNILVKEREGGWVGGRVGGGGTIFGQDLVWRLSPSPLISTPPPPSSLSPHQHSKKSYNQPTQLNRLAVVVNLKSPFWKIKLPM